MHPWPNTQQVWLELQDLVGESCLATAMKTFFASEWSSASPELEVPLTEGPTGSTVIRKGIELPRQAKIRVLDEVG